MAWKEFVLRLRALVFRRRMDEELNEELQFHLEMQARKHRGRDVDAAEAKRQAGAQFGSVARAAEECREGRGIQFLDTLMRDMRYALRMLRQSPSFTFATIATLALAIGANTVVFGALNAVMLRPLNVPQAKSLYALQPRIGDTSLRESYPNYLDLRNRNKTFDGLAAFNITQVGLDTGQNPSWVWVEEVTGNYFDVLRIRPYLGRFFESSDEHGPNSAPYVVLSYGYWQAHFHSDDTVVGRLVRLNKHRFTVIGVAPTGFHGTILFFSPQFFVPLIDEQQFEGTDFLSARGTRALFFGAMGHLKQGVSPAAAVADLNSIGAYLNKAYPKQESPYSFSLKSPNLYGDFAGKPVRAFLTALMLLAGLILLAACANLGSLFTARACDRSREIALRLALGAGRLRVMRQLLTEALLVSLIGGAVGIWGSVNLLQWLTSWQPFPQFPINIPVSPDSKVYFFALLLALTSGFLFGAAPVWQVLRTDPNQVIKAGSIAKIGRRRISGRDFLLAAQIAVCAILVTASFVAVRGLQRSLHANFGFEPDNTMLVSTDLKVAGYSDESTPPMQKRMLDAMETIPGVKAAGMVDWVPCGMEGWKDQLVFTDRTADLRPSNAAADPSILKISPGYFRGAGTNLLAGRDVEWTDDKSAPRVAVVNEEFARELFGSAEKALDGHYKMQDGTRVQVVGIVQNGKFNSLTEKQEPAMFLPVLQWPTETWMVLRSNRDPHDLMTAIQSQLRGLDPGLPSYMETWDEAMVGVLFPSRVATVALGILGLMGAILSVTGIFGMAIYSISKRTRELGIRMALGAQRREVVQAALAHAVKLLGFGSAVGLILGILASRVLASVVYEATPRDPLVLTGVVLAMALLGLVATWIPAQRVLSIDPATLLRED